MGYQEPGLGKDCVPNDPQKCDIYSANQDLSWAPLYNPVSKSVLEAQGRWRQGGTEGEYKFSFWL